MKESPQPVAQAKSELAVASKSARRRPGKETAARVAEARRALTEAKLARHIAEAVAAAPPLTPEQRARLSALLRADRP